MVTIRAFSAYLSLSFCRLLSNLFSSIHQILQKRITRNAIFFLTQHSFESKMLIDLQGRNIRNLTFVLQQIYPILIAISTKSINSNKPDYTCSSNYLTHAHFHNFNHNTFKLRISHNLLYIQINHVNNFYNKISLQLKLF